MELIYLPCSNYLGFKEAKDFSARSRSGLVCGKCAVSTVPSLSFDSPVLPFAQDNLMVCCVFNQHF